MTMQGERLDAVVAEAVAGDRNALREVLEIIRPIVVRYCRARVGTGERGGLSADDVAQEVCLAAITALPRYRDRGRPFLSFLYGIAAHKVADAHRAAGRDRAYPAESLPERRSADAGPEQLAEPEGRLAGTAEMVQELLRRTPAPVAAAVVAAVWAAPCSCAPVERSASTIALSAVMRRSAAWAEAGAAMVWQGSMVRARVARFSS